MSTIENEGLTSRSGRPSKTMIILVSIAILSIALVVSWFTLIQPAIQGTSGGSIADSSQTRGLEGNPAAARQGGFAGTGAQEIAQPIPVSGPIYTTTSVPDRRGIEVSGNLIPGRAEDVVAMTAGTLRSVLVQEGQRVTQGQVLGRIDDADLRFQIASREFDIEQERLSGSPRRLELLQMQYDLLVRQLPDFTITSPITGRVSAMPVQAGRSVTRGQTVFRVIDTNSFKAEVQVDELDIPQIQRGLEVEVLLDALPGLTLFGTVTNIGLEGTPTGNGFTLIPVTLEFSEPDPRIIPGFSFSGSIFVADEEQVVIVDRRAVQPLTDSMGIIFVVSADGTQATPTTVSIERFGQLNYRILSGVEPNANLMTPPADAASRFARPGAINVRGLPGGIPLPGGRGSGGTGGAPFRRP
jgi:membrane fusion protein (multidrug efflux system)